MYRHFYYNLLKQAFHLNLADRFDNEICNLLRVTVWKTNILPSQILHSFYKQPIMRGFFFKLSPSIILYIICIAYFLSAREIFLNFFVKFHDLPHIF